MVKESELFYEVLEKDSLPYSRPGTSGTLLDIGGGGLRCLISEMVEKSAHMVISLQFEGWRAEGDEWEYTGTSDDRGGLTVLARVMWCVSGADGFEVGVCFTGRVQ